MSVFGYNTTGTFAVSGASITVTITFHTSFYKLSFTESGLPSGTNWSVSLNGYSIFSTGTTVSFLVTNGSYNFIFSNKAGYIPTPWYSGKATIQGASVTLLVTFVSPTTAIYYVYFSETGLAAGTSWAVTFDGITQSSTSTAIPFSVQNGTYQFTVQPVTGYTISPTSGSVTVSGASTSKGISFTPVTGKLYTITFAESGLPASTIWSVALNGTAQSSSGSISFNVANGTYQFTIQPIAGFNAIPSSGVITVTGSSKSQAISFVSSSVSTYTVTFTESGLASGISWSVTLNGTTHSSTSGTIQFTVVNGTYQFTVQPVTGYTISPTSGSVTVSGANQGVQITFTATKLQTYSVTFSETGLPSGSTWFVNLSNGQSLNSTGASITVQLQNGSYNYVIGTADNDYSAKGGSVTVSGASQTVAIAFSQVDYTVTFTESNLPSGTSWSVTLDGTPRSSTTSSISFSIDNGTYTYIVGNETGYTSSPSTGTITVHGSTVSQTVSFTSVPNKPVKPNSFPLSGTTLYAVLGGIAAVIAISAAFALSRRKKKS